MSDANARAPLDQPNTIVAPSETPPDWRIFLGRNTERTSPVTLPDPPNWRRFDGVPISRTAPMEPNLALRLGARNSGATYQASDAEIDLVNAALYLRRPLLLTGGPGTGKSSLAYAVARELGLGRVLRWSVTSRSSLQQGLYFYDALARLQEASLAEKTPKPKETVSVVAAPAPDDIGRFIRLGPLGTALLPTKSPRVLLIDELDKSDIDLPNDLLNIFEEGEYPIPELKRLDNAGPVWVLPHDGEDRVPIEKGHVQCSAFPFVVITSNGEREFSPPFLRRCLRLTLQPPDEQKLTRILDAHSAYGPNTPANRADRDRIISLFLQKREEGALATDQLMNAIFLITRDVRFGNDPATSDAKKDRLVQEVLRLLSNTSESP